MHTINMHPASLLTLERRSSGTLCRGPWADSLVSQDDGENFVTEIMGWEQRIWTENVLFGPWGPLS